MAGTQEEWEDFLNDPLNRPVTDIPGVDSDLGEMMEQEGFDTTILLQKFVELDEDEVEFSSWLEQEFGATPDQASTCAKVLAICKQEEEQDWDTFISELDEEKPLTTIPGIGRALGRRLTKTYSNIRILVQICREPNYGGHGSFASLMSDFDATKEQAEACANALREWNSENMYADGIRSITY